MAPTSLHTSAPVVATHHQPVHVVLKPDVPCLSRSQFPTSLQHSQGLKPIINRLVHEKSPIPINCPVLLVPKPSGSYCFVQDLCLINATDVPIHLVVPNS